MGPYGVVFTREAQGQLAVLSSRQRVTLERELKELSRLAGLRRWLSAAEGAEPIQFRVGRYEVNCQLEPGTRTLRVTALREPAG